MVGHRGVGGGWFSRLLVAVIRAVGWAVREDGLPPAYRKPGLYCVLSRRLEALQGGSKLPTAKLLRVFDESPMPLPGCHNRFGSCN